MTELERLREENKALRRALLRLRNTCLEAAVMVEHRYPASDVAAYLSAGADAAGREVMARVPVPRPGTAVTP